MNFEELIKEPQKINSTVLFSNIKPAEFEFVNEKHNSLSFVNIDGRFIDNNQYINIMLSNLRQLLLAKIFKRYFRIKEPVDINLTLDSIIYTANKEFNEKYGKYLTILDPDPYAMGFSFLDFKDPNKTVEKLTSGELGIQSFSNKIIISPEITINTVQNDNLYTLEASMYAKIEPNYEIVRL
jgi:hypothetical protein